MSRSMKSLCNNLVRRTAGWTASFLAVIVSLLGRSGDAAASPVDSQNSESLYYVDQEASTQVSYVQLGFKDGEDWPPPRPE